MKPTAPRPGCGWDPTTRKPRSHGDAPHALAVVALDRLSAFVLCEDCAALRQFRGRQRFLLLEVPA